MKQLWIETKMNLLIVYNLGLQIEFQFRTLDSSLFEQIIFISWHSWVNMTLINHYEMELCFKDMIN